MVLEKPSGLLTEPGRGPDKQDCLARRVQAVLPTARIVHRLDRDTSGLLLMALDDETHRQLSRLFADRAVEKTYLADIAGLPAQDSGVIDAPIGKDWWHPPRYRIDEEKGRSAITRWRVLVRGAGWSRLELRPITGRSHQLRVHLRHLGHPILGDPLYGGSDPAADRLRLHAAELSLVHPATGIGTTWRSKCPF